MSSIAGLFPSPDDTPTSIAIVRSRRKTSWGPVCRSRAPTSRYEPGGKTGGTGPSTVGAQSAESRRSPRDRTAGTSASPANE